MSTLKKVLWIELWFFIFFPILGGILNLAFGLFGLFIHQFLFIIWCWGLFAYSHYRFCRQEELLFLLQSATAIQAPVETVLSGYLEDRPREHLYRGALLFFVFPGYYWIHLKRSFDFRLNRLVEKLSSGMPLDHALRSIPGLVSRETALAVTVGQFSGKLSQSLHHVPDRRLAALWLELAPRLLYPLLILSSMGGVIMFMMIFIVPKFEHIFLSFKMRLPGSTEFFIYVSRSLIKYGWLLFFDWVLFLLLLNAFIFSSRAKWYFPVVSRIYRMNARGQFLQALGLMLEAEKPLPRILDGILEARLLPTVLVIRVERLTQDLYQGQPLEESLYRHGLITPSMRGLIVAAEKAHNLPWALQEMGDSLVRRSARFSYRLVMIIFPLAIFFCAGLIAFVAIAMFSPLIALLQGLHG